MLVSYIPTQTLKMYVNKQRPLFEEVSSTMQYEMGVVKAFFPTSMKVKGPLFSSRPCIGAVIVEAMAAAVVFSVKEALCVVGLVSRFCHRVCGHVRVVDIPGNIVLQYHFDKSFIFQNENKIKRTKERKRDIGTLNRDVAIQCYY